MIFKFRAWDKKFNYMEYTDRNLVVSFSNEGVVVEDHSSFSASCIAMQDYDLMQFSGYKDVNAVDIYPQDVVKTHYSKHGKIIGIVGDTASGFKVYGIHDYKGLVADLDDSYEVIGNVYENQGLIVGD